MRYLIFLLLLLPCLTQSQPFSRQETKRDLQYLKRSILQHQAGIEQYSPAFEQQADELLKGLLDTVGLLQHHQLVNRMCALAGEGHYQLKGMQMMMIKQLLDLEFAYLPLLAGLTQDTLFVRQDYSRSHPFRPGDIILSINGRATADILGQLLQFTPGDGDIQTLALRKNAALFSLRYYWYVEQPDTFRITFLDSLGQQREAVIAARTHPQQIKQGEQRYGSEYEKIGISPDEPLYTLHFTRELVYLKLPTFDPLQMRPYQSKPGRMYRPIFRKIARNLRPSLLIDLRGNQGGMPIFANGPLPYLLKPDAQPGQLINTAITCGGHKVRFRLPRRKRSLAFTGAIFVLVNGETFSAGASLARYLKEYCGATILGEEAGTRYEGFASGWPKVITLPVSGYPIGIPCDQSIYPDSKLQPTRNRGLLPDIPLSLTVKELLEGSDGVLRRAQQEIRLLQQKE